MDLPYRSGCGTCALHEGILRVRWKLLLGEDGKALFGSDPLLANLKCSKGIPGSLNLVKRSERMDLFPSYHLPLYVVGNEDFSLSHC